MQREVSWLSYEYVIYSMFIALYSKNMYAKMQILNNLFTCQFYMFFVLHVKFNGICSNETYFHFTAGTFSLMINNLNKRTFIFLIFWRHFMQRYCGMFMRTRNHFWVQQLIIYIKVCIQNRDTSCTDKYLNKLSLM